MAYQVILWNFADVLTSLPADTPEEAAEAAIRIIQETGRLYPGDKIVITDDEEC